MLAGARKDAFPSAPQASPLVQYRPAIDGLRAVAVLAVCIFHLNHGWLPGGFVGVDVFFVISGYLITSILRRDCEHATINLGRFYQRRVARLLPAFVTVAVVTLVSAYFLYSEQDLASAGAVLTAASLSVANLKLMLQGNYFVLSPDAQPFLHYWSLSVEEQFYMLFPVAFLLLNLRAKRYKTLVFATLCGTSLIACIALTHTKPTWAFFLLPTRAWELLTGSMLADLPNNKSQPRGRLRASLSLAGLALILVSLFVINDGSGFPGYLAVLPVLGTACFLGRNGLPAGPAESLLSWTPLVLIGRMSYSLYLWHWPIFSLVDYKFYLASASFRLGLKAVLTLAATTACFVLIEKPCRVFLNHPSRRRIAFSFLGCALLSLVPLGIATRQANYINAELGEVAQGGLIFNKASRSGSLVVMGDSNGSMYGKVARSVATQLHLKLNVISVVGGDPLPYSSGRQSQLWIDSLSFVEREKPDFVVFVCNWRSRLNDDSGRLGIAVDALRRRANYLVLITQPPQLPKLANRVSMRNGSRPPFFEDPVERAARTHSNALLKSLQRDNVIVIDIESLFTADDGSVRFASGDGKEFYQDVDHLSGLGADLVRADVLKTITSRKAEF
ncbi:MAG: acyltransferase 3 [Bryobacterales bacterium]|nr:acyltransferase 3 [Bryobacterales bacterium]